MRICLVGCGTNKNDEPTEAQYMYVSWQWNYKYKAAETLNPDKIYILSAKYGLLKPTDIIEPYNHKLTNKESKEWSDKVINQLKDENIDFENDEVYFFCGELYRKNLINHFKNYIEVGAHKTVGKLMHIYKNIITYKKYEGK